jgi:hypothetical protein
MGGGPFFDVLTMTELCTLLQDSLWADITVSIRFFADWNKKTAPLKHNWNADSS